MLFRLARSLTLGVILIAGTSAAQTEPAPCRQGISREMTERIFALLNQPPAETACRFEGVQTDRSRLVARWAHAGTTLPPISVVPRECAPANARHAGEFAIEVPPEIARLCPSVITLFDELTQQVEREAPAGRQGSIDDPLFRGARLLFVAMLVIAGSLALRGLRQRIDLNFVALGIAGFVAALVVRLALPFTLGNWYSEVLPATGPPPWMRFGPGFFAFQSLLRDVGLWSAQALMWSQLVLGALAVPLVLAVLYELRLDLAAGAATVLLLVLAPFHARLSATTSEHVLASTLCMALLLAWLRALRRGDLGWFVLALLLFPLVCATRVDMSVQACLVLLWPLLRDRVELVHASHRTRWGMIACMALTSMATLWTTYELIAVPSQHPLPDLDWFRFALRYFVPQFWWLATTDPYWISLSSVLLAVIGLIAMAIRRPLLFVRVGGTMFIAFVASGHTFMHDELVGARYFLFIIPVFLMASGYGFGSLLDLVPHRLRAGVAVAGLLFIAIWTGTSSRTAYAARYAFQDEYAFARDALAQLPADCIVYQERIRADALPGDLDCCLDIARSPLVLQFPALHFADLPERHDGIFAEHGCVAYYEGGACAIVPGPPERSGYQFAQEAAAYFQPRCSAARQLGRLDLVAETAVAARTTRGLFADERPRVRLYRWTP